MSKRLRTDSYAVVTQEQGYSAGSSLGGSGGYPRTFRKNTGGKPYRKGRRMPMGSVYAAIRSYDYRTRETKMRSVYEAEQSLLTVAPAVYIDAPVPFLGNAANQRIGNKIQAVGFKTNILFHNNGALPVIVRMLLLQIPQGDRFTNTNLADNLFDVSTPGSNVQVDSGLLGSNTDIVRVVNRNDVVVLRDKVIPLNGSTVDTGYAQYSCYCKLGYDQMFPDSDVTQPLNKRIVMVLIARQSNSDESLGTTIEYSHSTSLYFKDK